MKRLFVMLLGVMFLISAGSVSAETLNLWFFKQMYASFSAMVDQPSNGKGLKYGSSLI